MADFDKAKSQYAAARSARDEAHAAVIAASARATALRKQEESFRRSAGADDKALDTLIAQRKSAEAAVGKMRAAQTDASARLRDAVAGFAQYSDPVKGVTRLPDDTPIALFPLRIETRYKSVSRGGRQVRQLWVRVYPDDILIDSFQPEISAAEFANVSVYWTNRWRAGGDPAGRRAAWLALARSHGAGRARWLVESYAPDLTTEPVKADGEHLLILRAFPPVSDGERAAIAIFWQSLWSSGGTDRDAAFAALSGVVGDARAAEIETSLVPANLSDPDVRPSPSVTARLVFLDLPAPASLPTSQNDWTRCAHAWLLPERLVLLGYRNGSEVLREVGNPVSPDLQIGPDPSAGPDDQIKADGADLEMPKDLRWTVDFPDAVAKGMGFIVDLPDGEEAARFDRLFVLGVRLGSDAEEGAAECATLIQHHQATRRGFTLLKQGMPTNNSDEARASYSWWEDNEAAYEAYYPETAPAEESGWENRPDGAWLAGLLGLDPAVLRASAGYHGSDQAEAHALNVALWPATLGYYMEQMMEPVFSDETVRYTRDFFSRFVVGRGSLPLFRIGRQPYGVVPASAWSRASWWRSPIYARTAPKLGLPNTEYLDGLNALLGKGQSFWTSMATSVSHVGAPGPDPQQTLLDIVGLHPASVEFYQRYSQSFTQYYNRMGFESELVSQSITEAGQAYAIAGLMTLKTLGWASNQETPLPELLEKIFLKAPNLLKGDLVAPELSETALLPVTRQDGENYIGWLAAAARTSHDALRKQEGFTGGTPTALLFMMLRHALDLGFVDGGFQLRRELADLSDTAWRVQRKEPKFIAVDTQQATQSRWQMLYEPQATITGNAAQLLGDFIPTALLTRNLYLGRQLAALDRLADVPTARLERAFVEHLDCLSYRLDAWRMGLATAQLSAMRQESTQGFGKGGLYVGAYGWVEDLAPRESTRSPVRLDPELAAIFGETDSDIEPLMRDSGNYGHIHAPSLDHAVTAAILRNGHLANATPDQPDLLAVDLSSERVRIAQQVIEGMRNGQSLGALLGYRLERALHNEPGLYLDRLIYDLRAAFPLVGNRNRRTRIAALRNIRKVEARNVIDGVAFAEHIAEGASETYPYGLTDLPALSTFIGPGLPGASAIGALIDSHVAMMRSIGDAVADLAISEGVYQVVRGNFERAAGSLDAFSKGQYPPDVEVVATPRSGRSLTHRVGLHLAGGMAPAGTNPRIAGEPALAAWVVERLPDPATIFARVSWQSGANGSTFTPSMADLGVTPIDLFYMVDAGGANEMAGFDDLLIDHAARVSPLPHDASFALEYKPDGIAGLTLFEVAPLVRALRGMVLGSRPLRPTDLALQDEASRADDAAPVLRPDKAQAVRDLLSGVLPPLNALRAAVAMATGEGIDPVAARDTARDSIDQWVEDYATAVRALVPFSLQSTGLTAAIEGRRRPYRLIHEAIDAVLERWSRKAQDHDTAMTDYAALPATATNEERTALLIRAQGLVSTTVIAPLPATIALLEAEVAAQRTTFDNGRAALEGIRNGPSTTGALLIALTGFIPQMALIDSAPFDLDALRDAALALAQDIATRADALHEDVTRRIASADTALANAADTVGEKAQTQIVAAAQAILGNAFILLPGFSLPQPRLTEWGKAWDERTDILTHLQAASNGSPYPVEDWLHGVARVRERLRHIEMAGLLGPLLNGGKLTLDAVQFPYKEDDVWLGLAFPETFRDGSPFALDGAKLLYTAHFAAGAAIDPVDSARSYCGLLIDEWVEVVPGTQETTGLSFHYDRPNSEPPQAVLLVTPPEHKGAWAWEDIVDAMHETLDLARLRAVEPAQIDKSKVAPLLPATLSAVTLFPITAMLNFALNNNIHLTLAGDAG